MFCEKGGHIQDELSDDKLIKKDSALHLCALGLTVISVHYLRKKILTRHCKTSDFLYEPLRTLRVFHRFDKHFSCHHQDEYVLVGRSWSSCVGHGVKEHL
jgi:hypothetical protein